VLPGVGREAQWRDVFPLAAAAVIAAQFGTLMLIYADPVMLRWGIAVVVLILLAVLMSGWRYHGRPALPVTLAVGTLAGGLGGATQIVGPPVIVYWLGSSSSPAVVRANLNAFFSVFALALVVTYVIRGLLPANVIALALLLGPLQVLALRVGSCFTWRRHRPTGASPMRLSPGPRWSARRSWTDCCVERQALSLATRASDTSKLA
jgi:hypothetical protein